MADYNILPIPPGAPTALLTPTLPPGYVQATGHKWMMYKDPTNTTQVFFIDYLESDPLYMIYNTIGTVGYRVGVASDPLNVPVPTPTTYKLWYYTVSTGVWTDYYWGNLVQAFPRYNTPTAINLYMYGTGGIFTDGSKTDLMITNFTEVPPTGEWGQGEPTTNTDGGTFDDTSDTVSAGTNQTTKASHLMNNYYVLDKAQVEVVKAEVWDITLPFFTRPSEAIISLMAFPFILTDIYDTKSNQVKIGNSGMDIGSHPYALYTNASNILPSGALTIPPYFGGFQDYAPYTKMQIYLPFIGYRDINPAYVYGRELIVTYKISYKDGSCIAQITSDGVTVYRHSGMLGSTVPLAQVDNSQLAATAAGAFQTAAMSVVNPVAGAAAGVQAISALSGIVNAKPSISGSAGSGNEEEWNMPTDIFLLIERPQCAIAVDYNREKGRPSLISKTLGDCEGFTSMVNPMVTAACTAEENDRINAMLKEGVIING